MPACGDRYLYAGLGTVLGLGVKPRPLADDGSPPVTAMDQADLESYRMLLAGRDDEDPPEGNRLAANVTALP